MRQQRRRNCRLTVGELEARVLLANQATGVWLGQDGRDVVGASINSQPNQIQDMHIAVSNLPADRTVNQVTVIGDGGGLWRYDRSWATGSAGWQQTAGATTADLYLDPYMVETGRNFFVNLGYDDGTTTGIVVRGGAADPNLWMPGTTPTAQWIGQEAVDLTGPGPAVGPDGVQDLHISLANLSSVSAVAAVRVTTPFGAGWASGTNPDLLSNAEFTLRSDDPTKGDLYFNPVAGMTGQSLTVTVVYANGRSSQTSIAAGSVDAALKMPAGEPLPVVSWGALSADWIGQDGLDLAGAGSVRLAVGGLPVDRSVVTAMLSDGTRMNWTYQAVGGATDAPLRFRRSTTDPSQADLGFLPIRNNAGETLTLVVVLDDGSIHAVRFAGGSVELSRLAPKPAPTSIVARPGDDLVSLVSQYGTIHLTAGVYQVTKPLFLSYPITITADPNATILFAQPASDPAWVTAINIEAGNTTLDGFAVRFAGPIRWSTAYHGGPSVIGNSDRVNGGYKSVLVNINLTHLDLLTPPPASDWEEAPRLIWMTNARGGSISDNTLRGGTTEFSNGPWLISGNHYQGTVPNTFSSTVFAGHYTYDTLIVGNTAEPVGASGKTWRFLVLTQAGFRPVVSGNQVVGIGPMDDDTHAHPNAPEVILTEAYRLHYEGAPRAVSADGWVVQVPYLQGTPVRPGDVVSILAGPDAGQWRTIAQVLSPTSILLDSPIAAATQAISISTGFIDSTFERNTIDTRGSSMASNMILAGNHFGSRVIGNHFLGGAQGVRITTAATEQPVTWGWSRAPMLGIVVQDNTIEDAVEGGIFEVEQSVYTKRSKDRTYMTISLINNTVVWSNSFVTARLNAGKGLPTTIQVGNSLTSDPTGLLLTARWNVFQGPDSLAAPPTWRVFAANLNGQAALNQAIAFLPVFNLAAPTQVELAHDSGVYANDRVTGDGRIQFNTVTGAAGYEYSLSGADGSYQDLGLNTAFLPDGLVQGGNTVFVRAYDEWGRRGARVALHFAYDTIAPDGVANLVASPDGRIRFDATAPNEFYEYRLAGSDTYVFVGDATSFSITESLEGPRTIQLRAMDLAGNLGPDSIVTIVPRGTPVEESPAEEQPQPQPEPQPEPQPQLQPQAQPQPAITPKPAEPPTSGRGLGIERVPRYSVPTLVRPAAWRRRFRQSAQPARTGVDSPVKLTGKGKGTGLRLRVPTRVNEGLTNRPGLKQRLKALLRLSVRTHGSPSAR